MPWLPVLLGSLGLFLSFGALWISWKTFSRASMRRVGQAIDDLEHQSKLLRREWADYQEKLSSLAGRLYQRERRARLSETGLTGSKDNGSAPPVGDEEQIAELARRFPIG